MPLVYYWALSEFKGQWTESSIFYFIILFFFNRRMKSPKWWAWSHYVSALNVWKVPCRWRKLLPCFLKNALVLLQNQRMKEILLARHLPGSPSPVWLEVRLLPKQGQVSHVLTYLRVLKGSQAGQTTNLVVPVLFYPSNKGAFSNVHPEFQC